MKKKLLSTLADSKNDWICVLNIRADQRDVTMWINEHKYHIIAIARARAHTYTTLSMSFV